MITHETETTVARQIEEGFARIRQTMETLAHPEGWEVEPPDFIAWKLARLGDLRDLQNLLYKQFDREEEGGFFHDVLRMAPQHAARVENLLEEHHKLIADLEHILRMLKGVHVPASPRLARIRDRFTDLVAHFERHEAEENRLLQDVYMQDYGSGD
ncbi:MAG: hypothetical protein KatS3mg042_0632 [Rhodothermaceae bacterium]|nr:MAG: hypothetical protein KatS3mg042_0632 [Rhodothermaceae bacterium]